MASSAKALDVLMLTTMKVYLYNPRDGEKRKVSTKKLDTANPISVYNQQWQGLAWLWA